MRPSITDRKNQKLGYILQLMYEAENVTGGPAYDDDWQGVTDHMVDMFTCLADGVGEQNPLGMSLLGS